MDQYFDPSRQTLQPRSLCLFPSEEPDAWQLEDALDRGDNKRHDRPFRYTYTHSKVQPLSHSETNVGSMRANLPLAEEGLRLKRLVSIKSIFLLDKLKGKELEKKVLDLR